MKLKVKIPSTPKGAQEGLKFVMYPLSEPITKPCTVISLSGQANATLFGHGAEGQRGIQTTARQFLSFCYTSKNHKKLNESSACYARFTESQWQQYLAPILHIWRHWRRQITCDWQRLGELWKLPFFLLSIAEAVLAWSCCTGNL